MIYRHATNIMAPFDIVDINFLVTLADYRIGAPVPGKGKTAYDLETLKARNVVGIYVTDEAVRAPAVVKLTGWKNPKLGKTWEP